MEPPSSTVPINDGVRLLAEAIATKLGLTATGDAWTVELIGRGRHLEDLRQHTKTAAKDLDRYDEAADG